MVKADPVEKPRVDPAVTAHIEQPPVKKHRKADDTCMNATGELHGDGEQAGEDTIGIIEFFKRDGDESLNNSVKCQMSRINKRAKQWKYTTMIKEGKSEEEALAAAVDFGIHAATALRSTLDQGLKWF